MREYVIQIEWEGPLSLEQVIEKYNNTSDDSEDCGLYQVYGPHVLYGERVLLYIGITCKQSFSGRFANHLRDFLKDDDPKKLSVYLGRVKDPNRYNRLNRWENWERDVGWAEQILIYKYLPSYNTEYKTNYPKWSEDFKAIKIIHHGERGDLHMQDLAPRDYLPGKTQNTNKSGSAEFLADIRNKMTVPKIALEKLAKGEKLPKEFLELALNELKVVIDLFHNA